MHAINQAIQRARRRLLFSQGLIYLGWAMGAAFVVAAITLTADRLGLVVLGVWVYPAIAGAAGLIASILALRQRPTATTVAAKIDDQLKLKDRLSSALWAQQMADDPFARFLLEDAQRTASAIDASSAFAVRGGRGWSWSLPAWAILVLGLTFLPVFDLWGHAAQRQQQLATEQQQEIAIQQILEAKSLVQEAEIPGSDLAEADPDELFKELVSLTRRNLSNPQLRRKAVAELGEIQQQLDEAYQVKEQQVRTLANQLSALDTGTSGGGLADRYADALRRGDYEQAQRELQTMTQKIEQGDYTEQEKQLLKQQMTNMAQQLQQIQKNAAAQQQQNQQNLNQQLQNAGLSQQQIQQIQQNGYNQNQIQQALQQAYQQQGMTPQQAQQQAQQQSQKMAQQHQQGQSQNKSAQQTKGLSRSMNQMAQSLGPPKPGAQPGGSQFSPSAYQAQQQLTQMQQAQQQLQQIQQAQQKMTQAMANMQAGSSGQPQPGRGSIGGRQAGTGPGGAPLGVERNLSGQYQTQYESDIKNRQGRVIASWQSYGEVAAGDATVEFNTAMTEARSDAERAVTDDRVPRKYHHSIKDYFDQLTAAPDEVQRAPAAPSR